MSEQQDQVSKSSCSSISTSTQGSEDDGTVGALLTEAKTNGRSLGKRLSHLDSLPHTPRVNGKIPDFSNATIDHESLLERLGTYGLAEYQIEGDGNCQFRALADQIFRNPDYHRHVRKAVVKQLKEFRKHYEGYVPLDYKVYLKKMKRSGEWGDHVTLQAAAGVVGLVAVHTLADGLGAAQFINAIADFARGLDKPTMAPVWARAVIPSPPKIPSGPPPTFQSFGFQHFVTDVSLDCIASVKAEYFRAMGQYCSTFDVAIAKVWQARTRAIKYSPEDEVKICFFANTRHLLTQVLPKDGGFYGNCFYPITVTSTTKDVSMAGLHDVIKMIRDGKARLPLEFAKWASGDVKVDPYQLTFEHNVLFVSDWTRLGLFEADYGWGAPSHIIPFTYADYMAVVVLGAPPMSKKGTRIMTQCVEGKHLKEFGVVNRNMMQLVERNSFGRIKRLRMHDIIRELVVKDNFSVKYEEFRCGGALQRDGRRLVVHKQKMDIQQSFSSIHELRTFITLDKSMPSFTLLPTLSEKSRYMAVIELSGMPIESIPDAIGNLFNLRYLGLRGSKVKLLPKSIEKLSNLLTLDLSRSDIHGLCGGIVKLKKLRHLFAEKLIDRSSRALGSLGGVCIPKGLGNLTNLQTLQALDAQEESVRQLGELRQLRSLRIWNTKRTYCERLCESLLQMPYLCNLHVGASDKNEGLMLTAVPANLQKLSLSGRLVEETLLGESPLFQAVEHNLYSLRLSWSQLRQDSLPSLSRLANLTDLYLNRAYNEERMAFLTGWFPKLKHLSLRGMTNLKQLEIEQGAMVTLETLKLGNLNSMMEVPLGLEFLMPLEDLGFFDITCDLLRLLRECRGLTQWHYTLRETTTSDP